jgi:hypothetical protein
MARTGDPFGTTPADGHADPADVVLVACIAVGAVVGFSLTGAAALGTFVGAAAGLAAAALIRRHEGSLR